VPLGLTFIGTNDMNKIMNSKMKSESHIIDNDANVIIHEIIPNYWTIREYRPDYGIDLAIEIFEKQLNDKFMTLGEHIFIQVKGIKNAILKSLKIKARYNVEKGIKHYKGDVSITVLSYQLETSEIYTIQRMSNVVPVMLFVVDISAKDIYYININDYIDKIIIPEDPDYIKKKSKVIHIPIENKLSLDNPDFGPLRFYAKRPKFYAFFNKISYQYNELSNLIPYSFIGGVDWFHEGEYDSIINKVNHFIRILKTFDVWGESCLWGLLAYYEEKVNAIFNGDIEPLFPSENQCDQDGEDEKNWNKLAGILIIWEKMNKLYPVYEEHCREFWLPTWICRTAFFEMIYKKPNGT
jgi:hypothetical protein